MSVIWRLQGADYGFATNALIARRLDFYSMSETAEGVLDATSAQN